MRNAANAEDRLNSMAYLTRHGTLVSEERINSKRFMPHFSDDLRAKVLFFESATNWKNGLQALMREGSAATAAFRMARWLHRSGLSFFAGALTRFASVFTGCIIGCSADVGPGLVILHSRGIVVHKSVKAGRNLVLGHAVTIGRRRGGTPIIGHNVYIGTGAVLMGAINVGDRARIGANAVVIDDVPEDATVVGVPARVVKIGDRKKMS